MAQPAGFAAQDNRTDMGIPVFWASANLDPPWQFKIWFEQFRMAVTVKQYVNPEVILEAPKDILEKPPPRPETPRKGETEAATTARNLRDKLASDRVMLQNEERRTRGPRVIKRIITSFLTIPHRISHGAASRICSSGQSDGYGNTRILGVSEFRPSVAV